MEIEKAEIRCINQDEIGAGFERVVGTEKVGRIWVAEGAAAKMFERY